MACFFSSLLPLREKVARAPFLGRETDEGAVQLALQPPGLAEPPPHPALRATFSREGRRRRWRS